MDTNINEDTVAKEDTCDKEVRVGEEILQDIKEEKDEKHRKIMKQHLRWSLRRVDELLESKEHLDEKLHEAQEDLQKVSKMTLAEFGSYIKEKNIGELDSYDSHSFSVRTSRTVNDNKNVIRKKLKMTFRDEY